MRKPSKYVRHYSFELAYEKELTDQEVRLFHVYKLIVDWDKKHADTFGCSEITIRQLQEHYLPHWSTGKVSQVRSSLIEKGWLLKRADGMTEVNGYRTYRIKQTHSAEDYFQNVRNGVQNPESPVQENDTDQQNQSFNYNQFRGQLSEKMRF